MEIDYYKKLYSKIHLEDEKYRKNNQGLILHNDWKGLLKEGCRIIDFGCGNGKLCSFLSDEGFDITGVDITKADYDRSKYKFIEKDLINEDWNISDKFEVALCFDVLEHFSEDDIPNFLNNFFKVGDIQIFSIAHYGFKDDDVHMTVKPLEEWMDILGDKVKVLSKVKRKHKDVTLFIRENK